MTITEMGSWLFYAYFVPMLCALWFSATQRWAEYREERRKRAHSHYYPTLTVGHIIGDLCLSCLPVVNIFIAVFRAVPLFAGWVYDNCAKIGRIPLVPRYKGDK